MMINYIATLAICGLVYVGLVKVFNTDSNAKLKIKLLERDRDYYKESYQYYKTECIRMIEEYHNVDIEELVKSYEDTMKLFEGDDKC